MKNLYIESCLETLKRNLEYDYVVASPPDFNELQQDTNWSYKDFLLSFAELLNPQGNFVSIYILHTHKIWVKSTGVNLYRLNYQHLLTFSRNKQSRPTITDFAPDVFVINQSKYKNYSYGMPVRIIELLIKNYTDKNNVVYDPFMGSGTTAEACLNTNREWLGSEIDEKYADLIQERMALEKNDL